MRFHIELDRENDGRWIAEIEALPGVMAYGKTKQEAVAKVKALALRVLADQVEKEVNHSTRALDVSIACSAGPVPKRAKCSVPSLPSDGQ